MKLRSETPDGRIVELSISAEMIERVLVEWKQEHSGSKALPDMGSDEFARRLMVEIRASARVVAA